MGEKLVDKENKPVKTCFLGAGLRVVLDRYNSQMRLIANL
jgi:hypothetical protein